MAISVFYSWQSDSPSKTNRAFIKAALEAAIEDVGEVFNLDEAIRLDHDTQGIAGSPEIANTILTKIEQCKIFVPDLTIVAKTSQDKLVPNPNVLIEYGWALKALGSDRIVAVMNESFGSAKDGLPFDLAHRRWPLRYALALSDPPELYAKQRESLRRHLAKAITTILQSGILNLPKVDLQATEPKWNSSSFLGDGERLARVRANEDVFWNNGPECFLRILPTLAGLSRSSYQLKQLAESTPMLRPMGRGMGIDWAANQLGAVAFTLNNQQVDGPQGITQLFRNGEIWGIDKLMLSGRYIPSTGIEQLFQETLRDYLVVARDKLQLQLPLRFEAGLSDIEDFQISVSERSTAGNCVDKEVIYKGLINTFDAVVEDLLLPFFQAIWEACGMARS